VLPAANVASTLARVSVVVLSDIHGVLPALEAVLAEPEVQDAERIVLTGDIAAGPQPVEVLDRLAGLGERAVWVRGNCERELLDLARDPKLEVGFPISRYAADQLSGAQLALLENLPHPVTVEVDGFGPVLFCHGTPRDDEEMVLVDTRLARWAEVLADVPQEVRTIVCGHTHMPFVRLVDRRLVINAGSVGMSYGQRGADWVLLERGGVSVGRTRYDVEAARAAIRAACDFPDIDQWTEEYLYSRNSDSDALAAFGPHDGRTG
jgi:putative phosphoesterase